MKECLTMIILSIGICIFPSCAYTDKNISNNSIYSKYIGKTVYLKREYNLYKSNYNKETYRQYWLTRSTARSSYLVGRLKVGHPLYIEEVRLWDGGGTREVIALGLVKVDGEVYECEQVIAMYDAIGRREPSAFGLHH